MQFKQQQKALQASDGVLRSVTRSRTDYETPQSQGLGVTETTHYSSTPPSALYHAETPSLRQNLRKRPASPVSISEAVGLLGRQAGNKKLRSTPGNTNPDIGLPRHSLSPSRLQICQTSTPVTPSRVNNEIDVENPTPAPRLQRVDDYAPEEQQSSSVRSERKISGTLSPQPAGSNEASFGPDRQGTSIKRSDMSLMDLQSNPPIRRVSNATAATPPPVEADLGLDLVAPEQPERSTRPRPTILNTTAAQDMSLPSPSLSPVTAAANLQNRRGYFEDSGLGGVSASTSFEYSHGNFQDETGSDCSGGDPARSPDTITSGLAVRLASEADSTNRHVVTPTMMDIPVMLDSFEAMPPEMKTYVMYQLLRRCPKPVLHFVADAVNPALKCDFLSLLPLELCLNIVGYLDLKSLCRAAQVSRKWRHILNSDEKAWKQLFDDDGYVLPEGELQRAIQEGWGWQHASGAGDWERDLSKCGDTKPAAKISEQSALFGGTESGEAFKGDSETLRVHSKRSKRKATTKSKSTSRKQQKTKEPGSSNNIALDSGSWMKQVSAAEGPYAAANAAAIAVPSPNNGIPSLKNLHLYKSIYQRHHLIRKSWMQGVVKPRHLAFRAHQRHVVTCLQFDADKILTGSDDMKINVYDTQTGALRAILQGHEGGVWALQYEGNTLVSGSTDRSVRVWDIERGVCTQVFQGHTSTVRCLQILMPTEIGKTPGGKPIMMPKQPLIITGSRDSNLRVWKLPQPNDQTFFQAGPSQDDADCPYFVRVLSGHHHSVRAIAAHGDVLVSGSYDSTVRVWKISTGETIHQLRGHSMKVYSVVLDHERNRCISGSMDNLVKVWSLDTGSVLYNLEGHSSLVGLLDLQQNRLVSAAADSTLRIWDPEYGHCKSTLSAHTGAITCFQHDGQKVISGSDRTLKMWNVKNGEFVKDLLTDLSGVWQVKFDERRCVAAVQRNNYTYIEVSITICHIFISRAHRSCVGPRLWSFSRRCARAQTGPPNCCQY